MNLVRKLKNAVKCRQVGNSEKGEEKEIFIAEKREMAKKKTLTETLNACMINYNRMEGCYDREGANTLYPSSNFKQNERKIEAIHQSASRVTGQISHPAEARFSRSGDVPGRDKSSH